MTHTCFYSPSDSLPLGEPSEPWAPLASSGLSEMEGLCGPENSYVSPDSWLSVIQSSAKES